MGRKGDGFQWISSMREVDRDAWNRLSADYSPLLDWDWLRSLEDSGSVCTGTGWISQHLLLYADGALRAAAPLYVKVHSAGEFVFDYAWADAAEQLSIPYYPKLVAMSPLSPAVGYRFLIDSSFDDSSTISAMLEVVDRFCRANRLHGFSILWPEEEFARHLDDRFFRWRHQHYMWENSGLAGFEDYLAGFNKNQRRNIVRERRSMDRQRLSIRTFHAAEGDQRILELMYRYYTNTNDQFGMWAARFLTEEFFQMLGEGAGRHVIFCAAYEPERSDPVGMSMLLHKTDRMIGRYWGAARFVDHLHFNLCYYEPIEWAIAHGVRAFDPGMGSEHKIRRGFKAIPVESLHRFYDHRMQELMRVNIDRINAYEQMQIDELNSLSPLVRRPSEVELE
jgi:predicted N-acyltransferase